MEVEQEPLDISTGQAVGTFAIVASQTFHRLQIGLLGAWGQAANGQTSFIR